MIGIVGEGPDWYFGEGRDWYCGGGGMIGIGVIGIVGGGGMIGIVGEGYYVSM